MSRINSAGMFLLKRGVTDGGAGLTFDTLARVSSIVIRTSIGEPNNRFVSYELERFTSTNVAEALDGVIEPVTVNGQSQWNLKLANGNYTAEQLEIYCHRHFITVVCARLPSLELDRLWRELRLDGATGLGMCLLTRTETLPVVSFKAVWHEIVYSTLNDTPLELVSSEAVGETLEGDYLRFDSAYDHNQSSEWFDAFKRAAVAPNTYRAMQLIRL